MFPGENDIFMILTRVNHKMFANGFRYFQNINIHPKQVPFMMLLKDKGGLTQRELAKKIGIKPSTLNVTISRMEKNHLVRKEQDKKDQRKTLVYLTEEGRDGVEKVISQFKEEQERILGALTSQEKVQLVELLKKLENQFDEDVNMKHVDELKTMCGGSEDD